MLSSAFLLHLKNKKKEGYDDQNNGEAVAGAIRAIVIIFVLLVIVDIAVLIYALSCLFQLKIEWFIKLILVLLMLVPSPIGIITMIGVIIYYHTHKPSVLPAPSTPVKAGFYFF